MFKQAVQWFPPTRTLISKIYSLQTEGWFPSMPCQASPFTKDRYCFREAGRQLSEEVVSKNPHHWFASKWIDVCETESKWLCQVVEVQCRIRHQGDWFRIGYPGEKPTGTGPDGEILSWFLWPSRVQSCGSSRLWWPDNHSRHWEQVVPLHI